MPEGAAQSNVVDRVLGFAVRRVRFLTILVIVGGVGLIAAHDASWTSIAFTTVLILVLAFGWISLWFWTWVLRNTGKPRGH